MPDDLTFYTNPMSRGRIARWMLEDHHKRLPVVDGGRVVGIVTRHDLLAALAITGSDAPAPANRRIDA